MTRPPEDDQDLVHFLRHHRPNPPPARPDLEDDILASLPPRRRRRRWIVPSALAASVIGAIVTHQVWQSRTLEVTDTAALETYMENNWSTTIEGSSDVSYEVSSADYLTPIEFTE
jgi:hypothetical protein